MAIEHSYCLSLPDEKENAADAMSTLAHDHGYTNKAVPEVPVSPVKPKKVILPRSFVFPCFDGRAFLIGEGTQAATTEETQIAGAPKHLLPRREV